MGVAWALLTLMVCVGAPTSPRIQVQPSSDGGGTQGRASAFKGHRISVDFKQADLHNVLRLLAREGRINIIVSDEVTGSITMRLVRVPWDQVLDVVLKVSGLTASWQGDVVTARPMKALPSPRGMD